MSDFIYLIGWLLGKTGQKTMPGAFYLELMSDDRRLKSLLGHLAAVLFSMFL